MKIAHLISEDTGGAKTHIMTLLNQLNTYEATQDGDAFSVEVASLSDGSFYEEVKRAGIKTTLFLQQGRFDLAVARNLSGYIIKQGIDVLHCHGGRANLIGALVHARKLCPVVSTIHSDYRHDYDHHWLKKLVFTRINRWSLMRLDHYLTVTEAFKRLMTDAGFEEKRMHVIYNGVPSASRKGSSSESKKAYFNAVGFEVEESDTVVGTVTRLHPVKGTEVFLEAARIVCKNNPECRFVVAGSGEERLLNEYSAFIKSNGLEKQVALIGFQEDVHRFLCHIDINVLASYSESFSYSLLEGGLHGLPTIASAVGGLPEMIEDGKTGRLFPAGDSAALAKCVRELIDDKAKAVELGKAFEEAVVSRFSDIAMAEQHMKIYKDILL